MTIELTGVEKLYGSHRALSPIDLRVEEGEFLTLLGPSGCGKTTLLRILAGFVEPSAGRVKLDGVDITDLAPNRREVGLLFQSYALFPHMTVAENVAFGLRMRRMSRAAVTARVEQMLDLVSMSEFADRHPKQLSGGQQQRVALARVLAIEPKVLLLDEPLAALDRKLRLQMQTELAKLVADVGITTVFVTHDQEEAMAMSDRIAVMDRGVIAQHATPREVYDYPSTSFVADFVGTSNLVDGTVDGSGMRFDFDGGSFALAEPAAPGAARVMVRPEHLVLADSADSPVIGVIEFVRPLGESVVYDVRLPSGRTLSARAPRMRGRDMFEVGSTVSVSLAAADGCWVIPGRAA